MLAAMTKLNVGDRVRRRIMDGESHDGSDGRENTKPRWVLMRLGFVSDLIFQLGKGRMKGKT
jgi:hypothetical protein